MIALRNKPGGGGINRFVTVVLHGGGRGSKCGLNRVT